MWNTIPVSEQIINWIIQQKIEQTEAEQEVIEQNEWIWIETIGKVANNNWWITADKLATSND
jgi:hypothetical protein